MPSIVTVEEWDAAQALLRANFMQAGRNCKREYLLRSLIRCGKCGLVYVGMQHSSTKVRYYRCGSANTSMRLLRENCGSAGVRADELEELVWQDVRHYIENPAATLSQIEHKLRGSVKATVSVETEQAEIYRLIDAKEAERKRLIGLFRKGFISEAETEQELESLRREIEALKGRIEALFSQHCRVEAMKTKMINAEILLEKLGNKLDSIDFETKRELVATLVSSIIIYTIDEDGKKVPRATINYCFNSDLSICSTHLPE